MISAPHRKRFITYGNVTQILQTQVHNWTDAKNFLAQTLLEVICSTPAAEKDVEKFQEALRKVCELLDTEAPKVNLAILANNETKFAFTVKARKVIESAQQMIDRLESALEAAKKHEKIQRIFFCKRKEKV